jgi:glutathione S-transferase
MRIPEAKRSNEVIQRQTKSIEVSFAELDRLAPSFAAEPTIGELAVVSAIGYLDLRVPEDGWRSRYPNLARWLDAFSRRPSVAATKPPPA